MSARKNIMLGTAGHVDHGKTALVKLLTGCNTDRLAEEQQRGLTIDLGYAPCRMYDERIVGVVDVPGHVDFIRNMVAGAHGIDVVIFVVAANDGVMPQTREHLDILTLMGVRHGLIALTKVDLVDEELLQVVTEEVRQFVRGTFLEDATICPMSNITGEGFEGLFAALNRAVNACEAREDSGLFRLWCSSTFPIRGFGAIVTGIPSSGAVRVGDKLRLLPGEAVGRVRRLEVYGEDADVGRAGECVAFNLTDIDAEMIRRGVVLCEGDALQPVTMVEAELRLLDTVQKPLKDYTQVHLHVGTGEVMAHIAVLDDRELQPNRAHFVQLRFSEPLGVAPGERFVIRSSVSGLANGHITTIGGGRILGVSNIKLRRNRTWTLEMLAARRETLDQPRDWCAQHLHEADGPITAAELAARTLLPPAHVTKLLATLQEIGIAVDAGGQRVLHREVVRAAGQKIMEALTRFHQENPLGLGCSDEEIGRETPLDRTTQAVALETLLRARQIERRGLVYALRSSAVALSAADHALVTRIESGFAREGLTPPALEELPALLNERPERVAKLVRLLVDQGILIQLEPTMAMHRDAVAQAKRTALTLFAAQREFTTMDFRDALGVSRKYAVPLLDYFDAHRMTVRAGNRRTPGAEAKKALMGNTDQ